VNRAVGFIAAATAAVSGILALTSWANQHVSPDVIAWTALVLYGAASAFLLPKPDNPRRRDIAVQLIFYLAVGAFGTFAAKSHLGALLFTGVGFLPIIFLLYRYDERTHKTCPDCAERVSSAARICRYCRHEFAPRAKPSHELLTAAQKVHSELTSALANVERSIETQRFEERNAVLMTPEDRRLVSEGINHEETALTVDLGIHAMELWYEFVDEYGSTGHGLTAEDSLTYVEPMQDASELLSHLTGGSIPP
jgi:hypothetical protein